MDSILIGLQNLIVEWQTNVKDAFGWKNVFEVLIIVSILMLIYQKFIKGIIRSSIEGRRNRGFPKIIE